MDACRLHITVPSSGGELLPGLQIYLCILARLHVTLRDVQRGLDVALSIVQRGDECILEGLVM